MAFKIESQNTTYLYDTEVENIFIGEYMPEIPGDFVKVYLYALMCASLGRTVRESDVARALHQSGEDVAAALTFLEDLGLVRRSGDDWEFPVMKEQLYAGGGNSGSASGAGSGKAHGTTASRGAEYRRLLDNEAVAGMMQKIQQTIGRFLTADEEESVIDWITELGVDPGMVAYAFEYSWNRGAESVRYVNKVLTSWAGEGLKTRQDAEEHLKDRDQRFAAYKRVLQALGQYRNPTEEERRLISSWMDDLGCSMKDILDACAKTAGISSPSVKYVDAVLRNRKEDTSNGASPTVVKDYYAMLREEAEREAEERRREVYRRVPEIREIDDARENLGRELMLLAVGRDENKQEKLQALHSRNDELERKYAELLTRNNIPVDYADVKYHCELCHDTGLQENGGRCQCYIQRAREAAAWANGQNAD